MVTETPISAMLICEKPDGSSKAYSLSLIREASGWTTKAMFGPAAANPLPQTHTVVKGVPYEEALKEFFVKYEEKLTQKSDTYTVKTESIPAEHRFFGESNVFKKLAPKFVKRKGDWLLERLEETIAPGIEHKMPVLLDGPPGSGKTYTTRQFGLKAGFARTYEVAGHSGVEAMDLLGSFLPDETGALVWVDGPVTAAYRAASQGKKALLIIDEIYRIPSRQRNVLLNALIPHTIDDESYYMLRAGRVKPGSVVDGVGNTEIIATPVKNLSIVATTNIGAAYGDVEVDDPAMKERWLIIHVKMDEKLQKNILLERCARLRLPARFAEVALELGKATRKMREDESIESELSARLTIRLLDLVRDPTRAGFVKAAKLMSASLTGRNPHGDLVEEHETAYNKAIELCASKIDEPSTTAAAGGPKI